ncbi:MAG: xanthine dehydrogenase family protein molybdopterin-binding subunit [Spirochaetota bacterium]
MKTEYSVIGKRIIGIDEKDKVLGNVIFADDFTLPGMLHAKVFRAARASARIMRLDVTKARELSGVVCVLTARDVPHNESVKNVVGQTTEVGLLEAKHQVLAGERVRYWGEPIALVAAETMDIARAALQKIEVEYEDLPAVFDPFEAMKPEAPKIHGNNNIIASWKLRKGDVEKGFAQADVIVENTYRTPRQEHAHIEPESGVAWVDDMGVVNVRYAAQVIEHYRDIATVLGLPESRVRVIGTLIGGGFGGKEDVTVEVFLALLAWKTGRPVKLTFTREEMGYGRHKRHPYTLKYKTGATRDGRLVALEAEIVSDAGAYVYLSPWVLIYSTVHSTGPYLIPNVKVDAYSVLTNNVMTSAFRGFGGMQVVVAYEGQMDELASKLGLDPLEFRKKNFLKKGDVTASYQEITSEVWLEKCALKALEALGKPGQGSKTRKIGRGFACCWQSYGRMTYLHDTSSCWVNLELDGSAVVRTGIPDLGGGQRESVRAIVAEVLGLKLEEVRVISTDSQVTPLSGTVTATRALYMSGNAAKLAAENVRKIIVEKAAEMLSAAPDSLELKDKSVYSVEEAGKKLRLVDVIKQCHFEGQVPQSLATFKAPFTEPISSDIIKDPVFPDFTFGAQAAEVEVDIETGEVRVLKWATAYDIGLAVNPNRVEGQMEGGAAQGLGFGLMEEYIEDRGVPLTWNLHDYLIPTSKDVPDIKSILLESKSGKGPFGAKGIGEPAVSAAGPAVVNAVKNAIGVRITHLPVTAERIFFALQGKEE